MTLADLYKRAEKKGIEVDEFKLRAGPSEVLSQGWIAIDPRKIESEIKKKEIVAHEIGHIETGSYYSIKSKFELRVKQERRAQKRAIKILIPYEDLRRALRSGICEVWELAEHFDETEDFIREAIELYRDRLRGLG